MRQFFAWSGIWAVPRAVLQHGRDQLALLAIVLMRDIPAPIHPTLVREYCTICKAATAAALAPLAVLAERRLFWPGPNEAARAHLSKRTFHGRKLGTTPAERGCGVGNESLWLCAHCSESEAKIGVHLASFLSTFYRPRLVTGHPWC